MRRFNYKIAGPHRKPPNQLILWGCKVRAALCGIPKKTPNLCWVSKFRFEIAPIFVSTVLRPVAEMVNKWLLPRLHCNMLHRLNDALVGLLFRPWNY